MFTRLVQKETLGHTVYHSGGTACTLAEAAGLVRELIPDADISFDEQAPELPFAYLIDNSRIIEELNFEPRHLKEGIRNVIETIRELGRKG